MVAAGQSRAIDSTQGMICDGEQPDERLINRIVFQQQDFHAEIM
jgi:hypothetical protein